MRTVWKFLPEPDGHFVTDLGLARPVLVAAQEPGYLLPCLWVEHDDEALPVPEYYQCFGTGHPLPEDVGPFVGSAVCADGALVWHVYRVLS